VRLEGHNGSLNAQTLRCIRDARKQCPMAQMHAIEITDGQGAWASISQRGESAKYLHGQSVRCSSAKALDYRGFPLVFRRISQLSAGLAGYGWTAARTP
jgi:hypothetical protein